jgi:hypothetical protein
MPACSLKTSAAAAGVVFLLREFDEHGKIFDAAIEREQRRDFAAKR